MTDRPPRKPRWLRLLLCVDQTAGVLFMNGDEDETISSIAGKHARLGEPWACRLCRILDAFFGRDHCAKAIEGDEGRRDRA